MTKSSNSSANRRMPALIERRKMTRATYQALKRHILRERAKRKQEQEADLALERQRKELERRRRLENENKNSLQQTKDEIVRLTRRLEDYKKDKSKLFGQLKRLLETENTKKENEKKLDAHFPMGQTGAPNPTMHFLSGTGHMGRPVLYKPSHTTPAPPQASQDSSSSSQIPAQVKRPRSPSPGPTNKAASSMYQFGNDFNAKIFANQPPSTQASKVPVSQSPSPMFHSAPGKFGHGNQSNFPPYLHSQHAGPPLANHSNQKLPSEAFAGLGSRMDQGANDQLLAHVKQQHRGPPAGMPPSARHNAPMKGSIMTGYPVHSNSQGMAPQPPLGMLPHGIPTDRNPFQQREQRPFIPR